MDRGSFVHLHTHSEYSLLDGAARIQKMVAQAAEWGMPALGLTDHGALYGAIEFYTACKDAGVNPVVGAEVYQAPRTRFDKDKDLDRERPHLILLAQDAVGYRNLIRIVSAAWTEGFYYKPRVDKDLIAAHAEGLICTSACIGGQVAQHIVARDDYAAAKAEAAWFKEVFGDRYYLEIQDHGMPEEPKLNRALIQLSRELGLPLLATNDLHYFAEEDAHTHQVLLCVQTASNVSEPKMVFPGRKDYFFRDAEQMRALFAECPEAVANTLRLAERCHLELDFERLVPDFPVPPGHTTETYLEHLCRHGIGARYPLGWDEAKEERLRYELSVICGKGFSGYFLIVQDFVNWARGQGIIAQARGSAAGSIVAYLLGIAQVDPLYNRLMFERFLRVDGKKMPDIDVDFQDNRRDEVLRYVIEKYGREHVAQIATFGTLGARAALRDSGRALGIPLADVNRVAKMVPAGVDLGKAVDESEELQQEAAKARSWFEAAKGIEGLARHASLHAAGVVICSKPLVEVVPLFQVKDAPLLATQFDFRTVEEIGLLKMDFLGVAYLTVARRCLDLIRETTGEEIDLDAVPLTDATTYAALARGEGIGVFQVESSGMRGLLRELHPRDFLDLAPLIALYRPGPLQSGMVKDFIQRRHGRAKITYPHPLLAPVLEDTYGVLVYQEQVMRTVQVLAGFDILAAEDVLKSMGKKDAKKLAKLKQPFLEGCQANGVGEEKAEELWEALFQFASYAFNRAHASAYSLLMYQTAWLKCHYPAQYMAALLTVNADSKEKVHLYVGEARRMGLRVLPPDIDSSEIGFSVVPDAQGGRLTWALRFGLGCVKGAKVAVLEEVLAERAKAPFRDYLDLCSRVAALDKSTLEALIFAGALDRFGLYRSQMLAAMETIIMRKQRRRAKLASEKMTLYEAITTPTPGEVREQRSLFPEMDRPATLIDLNLPELQRGEMLGKEKELVGVYVTEHPVEAYRGKFAQLRCVPSGEVAETEDKTPLRVGGMIAKVKPWKTKRGDPMCFLTLEDMDGTLDVVVFPSVYKTYKEYLIENQVVMIEGKTSVKESGGEDEDCVAVREVSILADHVKRLPAAPPPEGGNAAAVELNEQVGFPPAEIPDGVVAVHVPRAAMDYKRLRELAASFLAYPGPWTVHLHVDDVEGKREVIVCEGGVDACPSLMGHIGRLLGEGCVAIPPLRMAA